MAEKDSAKLIGAYYYSSNKDSITDNVSIEEFKNYGIKLFGESYNVPTVDSVSVTNGCVNYSLNDNSYNISVDETGCGGTCSPTNNYIKLDNYEKKEGTLIITYKALFACNPDPDHLSLCSDIKGENVIADSTENVEEHFVEGSTLKLTFKVGNEDYYFVSSELVK